MVVTVEDVLEEAVDLELEVLDLWSLLGLAGRIVRSSLGLGWAGVDLVRGFGGRVCLITVTESSGPSVSAVIEKVDSVQTEEEASVYAEEAPEMIDFSGLFPFLTADSLDRFDSVNEEASEYSEEASEMIDLSRFFPLDFCFFTTDDMTVSSSEESLLSRSSSKSFPVGALGLEADFPFDRGAARIVLAESSESLSSAAAFRAFFDFFRVTGIVETLVRDVLLDAVDSL